MINQVVTYYVDVPGLWPADTQLALIDVWHRSWTKSGWKATVLTEADVRTHPRFSFFDEHFRAKPSEYGVDYTTACFMRWLAASHFSNGACNGGAVMLTDYDVINYGLEPWKFNPKKMLILCDSPPVGVFCGAIAGVAQNFLDMAELFAAAHPHEQHDMNYHAKILHQDDLSLLKRMFETKTLQKPDWFERHHGCALYDYSSWRTSKLVHYGYIMKEAGFWPKHAHIEKLRPF